MYAIDAKNLIIGLKIAMNTIIDRIGLIFMK